ncbi:class I SAM-dependent methyltransferase [Amycolatopsis sp. DSM 110486]|uniref:class I SAM-dependent methyltransferase n=1 Tax=Amycolatopsis sp. DSM 110486 TaxID=2865832 RepID=UPI001C694C54|nr:class I SAM-dependent methyltransferase [Amycolatopsis sp. DSM 110486]QYN19175.1 methyltransferase domain-containing protein [Amycolatopsis sp. DSM 110486]
MQNIANTGHADAWNGWEGVHWAQNPARYNAIVAAFTDEFFQTAAIGEDDRVLDIGCGTGQVTLQAARRASHGHVTGVDLSAPMLDRAQADAAREGIANVEFEQGDAQVQGFPERAFDLAISRGGVMFFSDPVAAFANIRRALRPRGRLVFMGPQAGRPDSAYARATSALNPHLHSPSPAARGMGSLVDPARIRAVLDQAGFTDANIRPVEALMDYGHDASDAADFILSQGPVRFNLRGKDQLAVDSIRDELRTGLAAYETSTGVRIPGAVWLVDAARPHGELG